MTEEEKIRAANNTAQAAAQGQDTEELDVFEQSRLDSLAAQGIEPDPTEQDVEDAIIGDAVRQAQEEEDDFGSENPTEQDVINASVVREEVPRPMVNPLHSYATSTYGITLFLLTERDFNQLVEDPTSWSPRNALISSAGNYKGVKRNSEFRDDFYFENLKLDTVIGLSANTRGTNAIELTFSIIEPYGLTLLDRLVAAATAAGNKNYLKQPYLLQIDFFGSTSLGDTLTPIPRLTKRIPIMLIDMKIRTGVKGSEYTVRAVPFNHSAFLSTTNSTPANFEVKATTVRDFFEEGSGSSVIDQKRQRANEREQVTRETEDVEFDINSTAADLNKATARRAEVNKRASAAYRADSYTGAWNAWNQDIAEKKNVTIANRIKFVIDDEIADSKIVDERIGIDKTVYSAPPGDTLANKASQQGNNAEISKSTPVNGFDPSKRIFNISAGSSVVDVINMVMRNSEYIKNQVNDPLARESSKPNTPVDFYKITSTVKLLGFDKQRNDYAKETTYYIRKYRYYNTKTPNLPKSQPPGAVKQYEYLYTGKNIDIIDFSVDFDTAYFTTMMANRENLEALSSQPDAGDQLSDNSPSSLPGSDNPNSLVPNTKNYVANDMTATSSGVDSSKGALVANAIKNIYSGSRGDMLQVKLKILGDPHFIKQDDVYTAPGGETTFNVMLNSGTIAMDKGEVFCIINFNTPTDMDRRTGLTRSDGRYIKSGFSGYFRILKVESEFSKGQFVQTLECVRTFDYTPPTTSRDSAGARSTAQGRLTSGSAPLALPGADSLDPAAALNQQWQESDPPVFSDDNAPNEQDVLSAIEADNARRILDGGDTDDSDIDQADSESLSQLSDALADAPTVDIA